MSEDVTPSEPTTVAPVAPTVTATSPSALRHALVWGRDLVLSVVIAVFVILFLYQPVKVEGTSMVPSLVDQERIFINKYTYRFGLDDIRHGDLVVFWAPLDPEKVYIKRVIGVPRDIVEVDRGTVIVNGRTLDEPYVPEEYRDHVSFPPTKIRAEEYFVLGDHRASSYDSRAWGTVPRRYIYGKAVFAYWPLEKVGRLE